MTSQDIQQLPCGPNLAVHLCLQELAVDDVLDANSDPDHWRPATFTLKAGTCALALPPGKPTDTGVPAVPAMLPLIAHHTCNAV